MPTPMTSPPIMPITSAKIVKSGKVMKSASMRGNTKNSIGEIPKVLNAEISSLTFIDPSSAAKAAPVLPLMTMPTIIAPISRTIAIPTRSATKISEPYFAS